MRRRWLLSLVALWAAAAGLRLVAAGRASVIARDGIGYLQAAAAWQDGAWREALARPAAPLYSALLALGGARSEAGAAAWTALLSALLAPAAAALTARAWGARAGLLAGLAAASLPAVVILGGEVLSDGPYLALALGCLALGQRARAEGSPAWAAGAASLGVLAWVTRPEGILALGVLAAWLLLGGARERGLRGRAALAAGLALPALALALPYLIWMRELPLLGGQQAGWWKLTLKRNLAESVLATTPGDAARRLARSGSALALALLPALPALLGLLPRPNPGRQGRGLLALLGLLLAALLGAQALVRSDVRYGAHLACLALPLVGLGAARLSERLARRRGRAAGDAAAALLLLLPGLIAAWTPRRSDKRSYREAGAWLAEHGARRVLAHDSRAAFYAGAAPLDVIQLLPDAPRRGQAEAWLATARAEGADALLLREGADPADALGEALGPPAARFASPGAQPLAVFLVPPR